MSEFEPVEKRRDGAIDGLVATVNQDSGVNLLTNGYEAMGTPTAVKVYTDGTRLAFEPTNRGDRDVKNCYLVTQLRAGQGAMSGQVGCSKAVKQIGFATQTRYEIYQDDETGYWIIDPENVHSRSAGWYDE